jgi:hypothetical protein
MRPSKSKHYSQEDWVDFARNQVSQAQQLAMKQHLAGNCGKCKAMATLWTRIDQVATRGDLAQPPISAVEHVRKAFSMKAEAEISAAEIVIPHLSFDSFWTPAFADVRSGFASSRHVMYAAANINIHMQLQPQPKSDRVDVAGQVSMRSAETGTFPPIPVVIYGKTGSVATTTTNDFGEFHIAFVPERDLQISFSIDDKTVVIPLDSAGYLKQ